VSGVDLLHATLQSLRAHALRFALTSLGIVWGSFLLTFLTASMRGTEDHFTRELEEVGPKVVVLWPGSVLRSRIAERGARAVVLEGEDVERLASLGAIESASPDLKLWSQIVRAGPRTKLFAVNAVGAEASAIRRLEPAQGRFLTELEVSRGARVAYLGAVAADRLFGGAPALGRTVQIESVSFRVVGVGKAKHDQMIGVNGWDDWIVFVPWTAAQRWLVRSDEVTQISFAPLRAEASREAIRQSREILGLHHDFAPDLDTALSFFDVREILEIVFTLFTAFRVFLLSAGVVTLLVGAVGVMNIMLVVVGERTAEIGLRKAVGARDRDVFALFLAEAAAVCGASGVVGALLGIGLTRLFAWLSPPESPLASPPLLDPFAVAVVVTSLVGVGVLAGVLPALRAARIPPAEALRVQ
jgi:putative ABC transport system permease protein